MASSIPVQTRAVDPYASYNSNIVNQLTGIVTRGSDSLDTCNSLQVVPDSTSVLDHVTVLPGTVYKDSVFISIESQFTVDFTDPDHYFNASGSPFNTEPGIYYVVLEYAYVKSRPAPQARIKILLPSQHSSLIPGSSLFFLKAVEVSVPGGNGQIDALYDYDPGDTDVKREYINFYAGTETFLPTFQQIRDQSRIVYVPQNDEFYFGYSDRWGSAGGGGGGSTVERDTSAFGVGDLIYFTFSGGIAKAISSTGITTSDGVVTRSAVNGLITTTGEVLDVKAEVGVTLAVGNLLYLSDFTAGTVTNVKTSPNWQFVGRCIEIVDSTSCNMLYVRGEPNAADVTLNYTTSVTGSFLGGGWIPNTGSVYQDIDISDLESQKFVMSVWYTSTGFKIEPQDVVAMSASVLRVWMPAGFAGDLDFILVGPSNTGSPGGIEKVVDDLSGVDWISSGAKYYGVVDTSAINLSYGSVVQCYDSANEQVQPIDIQYDTSSVIIWMTTNLIPLSVVATGYSNGLVPSSTMTSILSSGTDWISDSGLYYQEIDISILNSSDQIVYETIDLSSNEKLEPSRVNIPVSGTLRIWMSDDTHNVQVTIVG